MTSVTGSGIKLSASTRATDQDGFTLLEVLVVLAIAGIIAGGAALGIGRSSGGQLRNETKKLYLQMKLAREDAVLLNRQRGLAIRRDNDRYHYRWMQFNETSELWNDLIETGYRNGVLPGNMTLELEILDAEVNLHRSDNAWGDSDDEVMRAPNLMFLSSGESTPFKMRLGWVDDAEDGYILSSELIGKIRMHREGEQ